MLYFLNLNIPMDTQHGDNFEYTSIYIMKTILFRKSGIHQLSLKTHILCFKYLHI